MELSQRPAKRSSALRDCLNTRTAELPPVYLIKIIRLDSMGSKDPRAIRDQVEDFRGLSSMRKFESFGAQRTAEMALKPFAFVGALRPTSFRT